MLRVVQAGSSGTYCRCGGIWEERFQDNHPCEHIEAVENAIREYWKTRLGRGG